MRLENLMVSHFLSVLDRLADPALLQFVKHLQSRAQGEVRAYSIVHIVVYCGSGLFYSSLGFEAGNAKNNNLQERLGHGANGLYKPSS